MNTSTWTTWTPDSSQAQRRRIGAAACSHRARSLGSLNGQQALVRGDGTRLQYAATAYNTYDLSVLSYTGQLEIPPEQAIYAEQRPLRKAAPGPRNWANGVDLFYLSECYGGTTS